MKVHYWKKEAPREIEESLYHLEESIKNKISLKEYATSVICETTMPIICKQMLFQRITDLSVALHKNKFYFCDIKHEHILIDPLKVDCLDIDYYVSLYCKSFPNLNKQDLLIALKSNYKHLLYKEYEIENLMSEDSIYNN